MRPRSRIPSAAFGSRRRKPKGSPSKKLLKHMLDYHGLPPLAEEPLGKLWEFHQFLRASNTDNDLTRLHAFDSMVERHYVDCLWISLVLKPKWQSPVLDIGSGAGFPGIPLAISLPKIKFVLAEPRPRRVRFLKEAISLLHLDNAEVFPHKVTSASLTFPVGCCISRAFASIAQTLPRVAGALQPGGLAMFMKGPSVDGELGEASHEKFKLISRKDYQLTRTTQRRTFLIYHKLP